MMMIQNTDALIDIMVGGIEDGMGETWEVDILEVEMEENHLVK